MTLPPLEFCRDDCGELEAFLQQRIHEFNSAATGYFDGESFGASQRDESGAVIGGVSGFTWGGCCFVALLWVAQAHRGKGLGASLLQAFERNAIDKGCKFVFLSSHSFQSPGFYTRHGYQRIASIPDYPVGHQDLIFAKRLVAEPAGSRGSAAGPDGGGDRTRCARN